MLRGLGHPRSAPQPGTSQWIIDLLFRDGSSGRMFDISRRDTLYQDTAFTTPVTAFGQVVKGIKDLSPAARHLTLYSTSTGATYNLDSGGYPCLVPSSNSLYQGLDSDLPLGNSPVINAVCCSYNTTSNEYALVYGAHLTNSERIIRSYPDGVAEATLYSNVLGSASVSNFVPYIQEGDFEATTGRFYLNGAVYDSGTVTSMNTTSSGVAIMGLYNFPSTAPLGGNFYGAVIYGGSNWPRDIITAYLASLAGIAL